MLHCTKIWPKMYSVRHMSTKLQKRDNKEPMTEFIMDRNSAKKRMSRNPRKARPILRISRGNRDHNVWGGYVKSTLSPTQAPAEAQADVRSNKCVCPLRASRLTAFVTCVPELIGPGQLRSRHSQDASAVNGVRWKRSVSKSGRACQGPATLRWPVKPAGHSSEEPNKKKANIAVSTRTMVLQRLTAKPRTTQRGSQLATLDRDRCEGGPTHPGHRGWSQPMLLAGNIASFACTKSGESSAPLLTSIRGVLASLRAAATTAAAFSKPVPSGLRKRDQPRHNVWESVARVGGTRSSS